MWIFKTYYLSFVLSLAPFAFSRLSFCLSLSLSLSFSLSISHLFSQTIFVFWLAEKKNELKVKFDYKTAPAYTNKCDMWRVVINSNVLEGYVAVFFSLLLLLKLFVFFLFLFACMCMCWLLACTNSLRDFYSPFFCSDLHLNEQKKKNKNKTKEHTQAQLTNVM